MKLADIVILSLAIGINVFMFAGSSDGMFADRAYIQVGEQAPVEIQLFTDKVVIIAGLIGDSRLQIQGGAIRFLDSPCRHKVCIRQGWLRHSGESSACLPNGLSIRLGGGSQRFDSTNF